MKEAVKHAARKSREGLINQEVIVTYNVRGMEKVWRRRDYKRVGISTYLLLDFEARVFTYYAPCND